CARAPFWGWNKDAFDFW
nr:immunoglobulin heavy chain junction region [Macaca mulatta]MOV37843.1 immunoglobulin heavy chain junction region [Macaca mulatta]MOV38146.1 immunoglobulin heavy chain junction region [Macaca mulatta]MOV38633.1 immunoglobulin heavy chain junction region [Macaca mulatta]MOV39809.1 immunoglobulin heavy chain junction region [Macaca mulatta]